MTAQLPLALRWPRRQRFEHFYASDNAAAVAAVKTLAHNPRLPWIYLHGPTGSGRSHLLLAACQLASAAGCRVQYLPLRTLDDVATALAGASGTDLLALDDIDAIAGNAEAERALFGLYNQQRDAGSGLLLAAESGPGQLTIELPDLRSRLGACTRYALKPLGDAERREVLKTQAAARGIALDDSVLNWLFTRYARDLGALMDLLDRLDQASLAAQRRITVPFLRELVRKPQP